MTNIRIEILSYATHAPSYENTHLIKWSTSVLNYRPIEALRLRPADKALTKCMQSRYLAA